MKRLTLPWSVKGGAVVVGNVVADEHKSSFTWFCLALQASIFVRGEILLSSDDQGQLQRWLQLPYLIAASFSKPEEVFCIHGDTER